MLKYIVKRILQMIPMMIILSIVVFCMVRLIPGDPVTMSLGMGAGKEAIAAETARLGLDKPLWQQYFIWVKNLFHGDFGTSISTHKAVLYEIGRRYPNTIKLAIGATIVSTVGRFLWYPGRSKTQQIYGQPPYGRLSNFYFYPVILSGHDPDADFLHLAAFVAGQWF